MAKPRIITRVTDCMDQSLQDLVDSDNWNLTKSQTIRLAIKNLLESQGYNLDTMPKRGAKKQVVSD